MSNDSREVKIEGDEFCPHCSPCRNMQKICDADKLNVNYDAVLRGLASYVGTGGSDDWRLIEPKVADEKIRWGIDHLLEAAQSRHAAEREALIRKCLEICEVERNGYDEPQGGWDRSNPTHAEYFGYQEACNDIYKKILALLDSGSQG
jgi:hypothetical protein